MNKIVLFLAAAFLTNTGLFSQKSPEKFGKNIEHHLNSEICPIDSSAGAYVIFDFGVIKFDYSSNEGFFWTQHRHMRIKILNKNEFDQASFSIPIYDNTNGEEKVSDLKAVTYNLKNGKIVQNKIGQRDGIIEERSEYWNLFKFALPNVEEGSIIEINYKIRSPFVTYLRDWEFQLDIPVLHSEVYVNIPEYYDYHQNMKGYFRLTSSEIVSKNGSFLIQHKGETYVNSAGVPGRTHPTSETINFKISSKHFVSKNLPALKEEDFVDNMENYRSSVEFELSSSRFGSEIKSYTTSWKAVVNRLLEANYFGQKLNKVGYAKSQVKDLKESYPDKKELMNAIYYFVQQKIKWNGYTGLVNDGSLREVYNNESGRAADINFILLNMLKEAGFNALPVALSTRQNGIILPTFPTRNGFNNMIALVILDGENILLDASSSYCPPGVIPSRCLNGKGRIIDKNYNSWIDLEPKGKFDELKMYDLKINELGEFSGDISFMGKAYASINFRHEFEDALSTDKMIANLESENPGMEVLSHEFMGLENQTGPIQTKLEVQITQQSDFMGDIILFNPLLYERIENNPFKLENREYPVNYTYTRNYKYIYKYVIPEGYEVQSLPQPLNMATPDKSAHFLYSATNIGNMINLTVMLKINKVMFIQNEYFQLKEFYNHLVAKESEHIILKKISNP